MPFKRLDISLTSDSEKEYGNSKYIKVGDIALLTETVLNNHDDSKATANPVDQFHRIIQSTNSSEVAEKNYSFLLKCPHLSSRILLSVASYLYRYATNIF